MPWASWVAQLPFSNVLSYAQEVEGYYELTNGELVEMPPELYDNLRCALKR
ncbi:hypothetical protein [Phormidium tenue]|uniref:hypothetical protein n=1 Tax=Phormidium tenue TaxID=126344 RepID=UPI0015C53819|nr:hypothetical protein [Phormidium tenue]MBD2234785.1 hypothetical protein [Phormidium tenue FACHB-1052]